MPHAGTLSLAEPEVGPSPAGPAAARRAALSLCLLVCVGCASDPEGVAPVGEVATAVLDSWDFRSAPDAGLPDTGTPDTGTPDTGTPDTGTPDTGTPDTGTPDTGAPDTGALDTGTPDTGALDTGTPDTGALDTGTPDTGALDTGTPDTGAPDAGTPDTGTPDTGTPDTGTPDTGAPDTGIPDTGIPDTGTSDTGIPDSGVADTGLTDTGTPDTGTPDTGTPDTGTPDTGTPDTGPLDVGPADTTTVDIVVQPDIALPDTGPPPPVCPPVPLNPVTYPPEVHTFRQGLSDYAGARDLHLAVPANTFHVPHPDAGYPTDAEAPTLEWAVEATNGTGTFGVNSGAFAEGSADEVGLIQFRDLVGVATSQLRPGQPVLKAELRLHVKSTPVPATVHRVLVPWSNATRWQSFGAKPGVQLGADAAPDYTTAVAPQLGLNTLDVSADVQAMTAGKAENHGWLFLPSGAVTSVLVPPGVLGQVANIRVGLSVKTQKRGELVVTLRHGADQAVLLNRLGRPSCYVPWAASAADLDVVLDPSAGQSVHTANGKVSPLTGTYRPDTTCVDRPLCTAQGGGLCGSPAAGRWWLSVRDEWAVSGPGGKVTQAWIELTDTQGEKKTFGLSPVTFPNSSHGDLSTVVHTSEATDPALRPTLVVTAPAALRFDRRELQAVGASTGQVWLQLPPGANDAHDVYVDVSSSSPQRVAAPPCTLKIAKGAEPKVAVPLSFGVSGVSTLVATSPGLVTAKLAVKVGTPKLASSPAVVRLVAKGAAEPLHVSAPLGLSTAAGASGNALVVSVADPSVVTIGGLPSQQFPLTDAPVISVPVVPGAAPGGILITVTDTLGLLTPVYAWAAVTAVPHVTHAWHVAPSLQVGSSGAPGASATVAFQTRVTSRDTADHDTFYLQWRKAPGGPWQPLPPPKIEPVGSTGRLRHVFQVPRPTQPGTVHVYLVSHLRNGKLLGTPRGGVVYGDPGKQWRMVAVSNVGVGGSGAAALDDVVGAFKPDLLLNVGDVVYPHGEWEHYASRAFLPFVKTAAETLVAPVLGNHDELTDQGLPLPANYVVPLNGPKAKVAGLNYWFDHGHARFFVINSAKFDATTPHAQWLTDALQASPQDWNIVVTHELPLTRDPFKIDRQATAWVREEVLDAAVKGGADLFIGAACHSWQRYLPVTAVVDSAAQVKTAACDAGPGVPIVYPGSALWARNYGKPLPATFKPPLRSYVPEVGTGVFDFNGDTLTVRMIDRQGVVRDKLVRKRCTAQQPCTCKP